MEEQGLGYSKSGGGVSKNEINLEETLVQIEKISSSVGVDKDYRSYVTCLMALSIRYASYSHTLFFLFLRYSKMGLFCKGLN